MRSFAIGLVGTAQQMGNGGAANIPVGLAHLHPLGARVEGRMLAGKGAAGGLWRFIRRRQQHVTKRITCTRL